MSRRKIMKMAVLAAARTVAAVRAVFIVEIHPAVGDDDIGIHPTANDARVEVAVVEEMGELETR